jgi:hypothetical protein
MIFLDIYNDFTNIKLPLLIDASSSNLPFTLL